MTEKDEVLRVRFRKILYFGNKRNVIFLLRLLKREIEYNSCEPIEC